MRHGANKDMSKTVASMTKEFVPRALWRAAFPGNIPNLRIAWRVESTRLASMVAPKEVRDRNVDDDSEESYQRRIARRRWEAVVVV